MDKKTATFFLLASNTKIARNSGKKQSLELSEVCKFIKNRHLFMNFAKKFMNTCSTEHLQETVFVDT